MDEISLDILTPAELASLRQLLGEARRVVIVAHKSPDGDAVGSSLAWAECLRTVYGHEATVVLPDTFPDFLQWMPGAQGVLRYDKSPDEAAAALAAADLVCCLDFNAPSRTEALEPVLLGATAPRVMIDHHLNPDTAGTALVISRPNLSSTAELVFRVIHQLGHFAQMTADMAVCLYTGMMTDTGAFAFNSTRPEIYHIICLLLTRGIDKDAIYRAVYYNFSPYAVRLRGYVMAEKMRYIAPLHAAYFTLTRHDMLRFHFVKGDAEGLVNEPLRIRGLRLSISLREDDRHPQLVWVSLRSVGSFPCNEMAERFFHGGGHLNASGGRLHCTMRQAETITEQALQAYAPLLQQ